MRLEPSSKKNKLRGIREPKQRERHSYTDGRPQRTRPGRCKGQDRIKRQLQRLDAHQRTSGSLFMETDMRQCFRRNMIALQLTENWTASVNDNLWKGAQSNDTTCKNMVHGWDATMSRIAGPQSSREYMVKHWKSMRKKVENHSKKERSRQIRKLAWVMPENGAPCDRESAVS